LNSQAYEPVRKLVGSDAVESFDCGQPALNQFLQRFALINQKSNSAQTYVSCHSATVLGFYSLAVGSVGPVKAAPRVVKGIPLHPVPVMILARLAVDLQHQGAGLGKALLKDALKRTAQAADIAGIRALLVHAKNESARQWYLNWEFEPSVSDPFHLFLLMKVIKAIVGKN
jgi:GNAT superfamily N-acetyltransferase